MPDAVMKFIASKNVYNIRNIQTDIYNLYKIDTTKYDLEKKLKTIRIYENIPSIMGQVKKRIVAKNIENKSNARFSYYQDEFDYLISSGITHEVKAVSELKFPLLSSTHKNLLKLYLNDVGILSNLLFKHNIKAIKDSSLSINLGSLYETAVASELKIQGYNLSYYDNRNNGEVDFLIDDYNSLSIIPIEVKSGRGYNTYSALNKLLHNKSVNQAYVFSNERTIKKVNNIIYLPIYFVSFL